MISIAAFLGALLAGALLAVIAPRLRWVDAPEAAPERKAAGARVPLVGGAAVLLGFAAAGACGADWSDLPWPALLAALGLGLVDDLVPGGLPPAPKLAGQALIASLFALDPGAVWGTPSLEQSFLLACLAVVAMNAINLFDHADGLVGGLAALALAVVRPAAAAAYLGFLPHNTLFRTRRLEARRSTPRAFLGDSGSHFTGILLAAHPASALFLLVPLLDAARVAAQRIGRDQAPWVGDRTHLGHRIAALGAGPLATAAIAVALSAPLALVPSVLRGSGPLKLAVAISVLAYAVTIGTTVGALPPAAGAPRPGESAPAEAPSRWLDHLRARIEAVTHRLKARMRAGDRSGARGEGTPAAGGELEDDPTAGPFSGPPSGPPSGTPSGT